MPGTGKKKRETMSLEELEAWKTRLKEQEKTVNARIKAKKSESKKEARKAESNAKFVLGGMLLAKLGGDWTTVDFEAVRKYLNRYEDVFHSGELHTEKLPLDDARKRLRKWESNVREHTGNAPRGVTTVDGDESHGEDQA